MDGIENLVKPKSVAVIGASHEPSKIGHQILDNLIKGGYNGKIFPVNPKGGEILGRKVYSSISEVKEDIGMAVVVIPAPYIASSLKECAAANVKSVIVISAGFGETGEEGKKLQTEITDICKKADMAMLGPNCLGFINTNANLNASFSQSMPKKGNISLVSQSGAMITALIDWSDSAAEGFSKIFSMGNKADINEEAVFEYLYNDPETDVIVAYLEQLTASKELTELFAKYSKTKPTIVLFGGKTSFGAKAASSHTGSLISSYLATETYLKQAGVITANNLSELFIFCQLFSNTKKIGGDSIAVITNAGGPGIVTCDELSDYGLNLATFDPKTEQDLAGKCRPCANTSNPIDVLGDGSETDYENALVAAAGDKNVDGITVLLTPQSSTNVFETAKKIADFKTVKPIICAFIGGENLEGARETIEKSGKPCYRSPDEAVAAVNALVSFNKGTSAISVGISGSEKFNINDKEDILKKFNLPVLEYLQVETLEELKEAAGKIGYPVVLKTAKPEISHKSDSGGVKLNISNDIDLKAAFSELGSPVIIGKMVRGKIEIFLGIKRDPQIGTLIAFGTGGIYSEIYKDISYRVAPITLEGAKEMIKETKMGQILNGARGQNKYDLDKLAQIIVDTAKFADSYENISEIDFNPLIAEYPDFYIVDTRIIEK